MDRLQLPSRLERASRVIISGAGGGFDVFAGLPLYFALRAAGKEVFLANLSFTYLGATDGERLTPVLVAVRPETTGPTGYFPELHLASFLATTEKEPVVYAFEKVGVVPLRHAWSTLVERLGADAIVLVDGGTDILMRGDEAGLGTPSEDMVSLAAVAPLPVPVKLVCCAVSATRTSWRTLRRSRAKEATSARRRCCRRCPKLAATSKRWSTLRGSRRDGRASSTPVSPRPSKDSSATTTVPSARGTALSSSTR